MSAETQAILLNAVPLFVLGGLFLLAAATLAPAAWRERRHLRELELTLAVIFPAGGSAAIVFGVAILLEPRPVGGNAWLGLVAVVLAGMPVYVYFARFRDRALFLTASRRAREAEERRTAAEERRAAVNAFTSALVHQPDEEALGRLVVETAASLLGTEYAAIALIEGSVATGLAAVQDGEPVGWWTEMRLDFDEEPSAMAGVVREAMPLAVYDVPASRQVSRRLAEQVGAMSAAFAPAVAAERVVAVLVVAATGAHRAFQSDELALLQELGAETALALDRLRSSVALADALGRERLVSGISRRARSELEPAKLLEVAVAETGMALGAERCVVRLGDAKAKPAAEWIAAAGGSGSTERAKALSAPIAVADAVLGVLEAHGPANGDWSADDVSLLESVARELGLALQTARLLEERERRLTRRAGLVHAAHALSSELELDVVLRRLVEETATLVQADAADLYLLDRERGTLRCAAVTGLPAHVVGFEFPAEEGVSGEALGLVRPVVQREYRATEEPVPNEAYEGFSSAIVAPVVWEGETRGVLGAGARRPGAFDAGDAEALEALASLAALALRNAEAFRERTRQAQIQRGFYRIASMLAEPLSLSGTLDAVAQAASEALGGSFAAVLMRRGGRLVLTGSERLPEELAAILRAGLPAEEAALARAAEDQRLLASSDVVADERFGRVWAGCSSVLAIPVQAGDPGVVLVCFRERRLFGDDDLELARHLAGAAQASLERGSLLEHERAARSLAQQLARTGGLLATELDPTAVLEEVVKQAPGLAGVEASAIRTIEEDELVVTAVSGADPGLLGARSPATSWLSGDVVQSRAPLVLEDAASDERLRVSDPLLQEGFRGYLGVPLTAPEGALHGVLALYSAEPKSWRPEEVEALQALAANASAALSNAELYQRVALEKERSVAILANIADGIVAVDREGHVVLWNNAAEEITGVPAVEALGRTPAQVLGRSLEAEPGSPQGDRLVSILRGGDDVWLSLTEAVMRDPAGAVAGRIFAFRDISSERFVEQMKSEFVSTVSQELRRPLTSIYGFAETLLRRDVLFGEEERRTFLGYIASESERLTTIVDALLNVARLDSGELQINLTPTDAAAVVTDAVGALDAARPDGHEFVVHVPDEPVAVSADPEKLRQVLANLVDNAVRYSPSGGTVTVAVRRREDRVEFTVEDEGLGIPQAERQRIFRKFYRGDPGGTRESLGGTGLGLFIVKGLVTAMGGRIWVSSREGRGSSFTFELPVAAGMNEPAPERV